MRGINSLCIPPIRFDGYRDFVIAMLPSLDHLDGTDIEHGERIRAVQRLDELRPLIASQEEEYRSGIKSKVSKLNPNLCFSSLIHIP